MPAVRSIAMKSIRMTIYSLYEEIGAGPLVVIFVLFILGNFF